MPFKHSPKRLFVCLAVIVTAAILLRAPKTVARGPWIAANDSNAELQRAVSWYVDHAHSALNPPLKEGFALSTETVNELIRAGAVIKEDGGSFEITPPYKPFLWWPGRTAGQQKLLFSPYSLELLKVEKTAAGEENGIETLQLTLELKVTGPSPARQHLEERLRNHITQAAPAVSDSGLVSFPVTMYKGIYGYYLPIPRAAFDTW